MANKEFDPLAYIEKAFVDTTPDPSAHLEALKTGDAEIPTIGSYLHPGAGHAEPEPTEDAKPAKRTKFKKRQLSAPRPRRVATQVSSDGMNPDLQAIWATLPKNVAFLSGFFDDSVTAHYYRGEFKESRAALIRRLLDPELSLEEVSRLLGVCPATVRRYTNRGWLSHHRTKGGQRRFTLSGVVRFVEAHGRHPEE